MDEYGLHFGQPWWLLATLVAVPVVWFAWRNLRALGPVRKWLAVCTRAAVVVLLAVLMARPEQTHTHKQMTLITVLDRSQSISQPLQAQAVKYLARAVTDRPSGDRLAIVDVAESCQIGRLPSSDSDIPVRNTLLTGQQTNLGDGVQMAMAIAPPENGARILLVSDGNETAGDIKEAARLAAANHIPIDVLPLHYQYPQEVVFTRLVAPATARNGQTIPLRLVLNATAAARGQLVLSVNGELKPSFTTPVEFKPGTNVKIVQVPITSGGIHRFDATFIPADKGQDTLSANNHASGITYVAGPGHILLVDQDPAASAPLMRSMERSGIAVKHCPAQSFPDNLADLLEADAVVMVDVECPTLSFAQQEMLVKYVTDLGGGLIMVGGPNAFGAGGWIGSPVVKVLPVDPDPPQTKQMPKGALVLVMHACEMPDGNFWGKTVAKAAVGTLSPKDLVGVLDYNTMGGNESWVYPFSEVGDKKNILAAIDKMQMGDMPDFGAPIQAAYNKLKACKAVQKHIIIISDGDPSPPSVQLIQALRKEQITCTGVAVFPHGGASSTTIMEQFCKSTGGRFYNVDDPKKLPQIFIKEAQVVKRPLRMEDGPYALHVTHGVSDIIRGLGATPQIDGYVLTAPKGGFATTVLASKDNDPILATCQAGAGRCVAFTSSADDRWAKQWLGWGGFDRFWEQSIRWAAKSSQPPDCEIFTDIQGRNVTMTVESVDDKGNFVHFAALSGQTVAPDLAAKELNLQPVGPGRYRAVFQADQSGSYLVNLRYRRAGGDDRLISAQTVVTVPYAPEFRDLSDNAALLTEIAAMTGGRVLSGDPAKAALFERAGVHFPKTAMPLTNTLLMVWLGLFLFDVGVRRLALDFKAMGRSAWGQVSRVWRPRKQTDQTIDQLKAKRDQLRLALVRKVKDTSAGRKYVPGAGAPGGAMPVSDASKPPPSEPAPAPGEKKDEKPAAPSAPASHLDRLIAAKKQAQKGTRH